MCEESLRILGGTAGYRTLGRERTVAEALYIGGVEQLGYLVLVDDLNLVILVRSTETVEIVDERHAGLQGCQVGNSRKVHYLLYRTRAEHGETSLAASHYILMVTEDTQRVRGQGAGRNVEHARQQLACNLVHIGDHQQQTLRCSKRSGECTSLQRTMYCTGCTSLRLHFLDRNGLAKQVLTTLGSPLVHMLCHRRRRSDGVDGCYFGKHVAHMSGSGVTITSDKLLFFCHFSNLLK